MEPTPAQARSIIISKDLRNSVDLYERPLRVTCVGYSLNCDICLGALRISDEQYSDVCAEYVSNYYDGHWERQWAHIVCIEEQYKRWVGWTTLDSELSHKAIDIEWSDECVEAQETADEAWLRWLRARAKNLYPLTADSAAAAKIKMDSLEDQFRAADVEQGRSPYDTSLEIRKF